MEVLLALSYEENKGTPLGRGWSAASSLPQKTLGRGDSPPVSLESSVCGGQASPSDGFQLGCDRVAFSYCDLLIAVQLLSHVRLFAIPWTAVHQASLSITNSQSLLRLHRVSDAIQPSHPPSSPSPALNLSKHRVFSNEAVVHIRWLK